ACLTPTDTRCSAEAEVAVERTIVMDHHRVIARTAARIHDCFRHRLVLHALRQVEPFSHCRRQAVCSRSATCTMAAHGGHESLVVFVTRALDVSCGMRAFGTRECI